MATFFQVRSLIDKATVDSKEPTSGYLYVEINKLTEQSDSACTSVLDYVMKRLRNKSPRVKQKALLVMKNCIEKGHPTFRQELQLRSEELRAELQCSGPPDPHEGDGPYRRVREEADRVINMMYDDNYAQRRAARPQQSMEGGQDSRPLPPPSFLPSPVNVSGGYEGVGGGGGGGMGPSSGKKYQGMGNWTPPQEEETWYGKAASTVVSTTSAALEKVGVKQKPEVDWNDRELYTKHGSTAPGSGYTGPNGGGGGGGAGGAGIRGLSAQQAGLFEKKKKKTRRRKGEAGGTWKYEDDDDEEEEEEEEEEEAQHGRSKFDYAAAQQQAEAVRQGTLPVQQHATHQQQRESRGHDDDEEEQLPGGAHGEEGSLESRLVEQVVRPGGVRAAPSAQELDGFCDQAEDLQWRPIAKALEARLDDNHWVVRLRALYALEALLERGRLKKLRSHVKKHAGAVVVGEASSSQKQIRARAEAVANLLYRDGDRPSGRPPQHVSSSSSSSSTKRNSRHQQQPQQQAPAQQSGDILAFLDDVPSQPSSASAAPLMQPAPGSAAAPPTGGLASLNLGAPTLQAGPTLAPSTVVAPMYGQPNMQPYYGQPQPQPMMSAPQQQPMYHQPMYGQPMYTGQPMMASPPHGAVYQQQPMAQPQSQPKPQDDSFNFVQDAMKAVK